MTTLKNLDLDKAVSLARAAVEERGEDFVYPDEWKTEDGSCLYVQPDGSGPACVVGLAFHKAGVSIDLLRQHEYSSPWSILRYGLYDGEGREPQSEDPGILFLTLMQEKQDKGVSWGDAFKHAYNQVVEDQS